MKNITINGHIINRALMIEDPDVRRTFEDLSGQMRHVRLFHDPARLKVYAKKHPEGLILAGVGAFFFTEPVIVTAGGIKFDKDGNADIQVKEGKEGIEKQLKIFEEMSNQAQAELASIQSKERS